MEKDVSFQSLERIIFNLQDWQSNGGIASILRLKLIENIGRTLSFSSSTLPLHQRGI